jgi:UDP-galactopyranose mutase
MANYLGEIYKFHFNMNTFNNMWGVVTPEEARLKIESQKFAGEPVNLEEQALSLVGTDIYEKLVKEYTEKQWGKPCNELPAFIIKRLPVRFIYNNDYFDDPYQGIPIGGYTKLVGRMLEGIEVRLNTLFSHDMESLANKIIYTGSIDEYYGYTYGALEYRSLRFEEEILSVSNYQGCSVMNYTDSTTFTRIIEHRHFEFGMQDKTVVTKEYPKDRNAGDEPYYPVNDDCNASLYQNYNALNNNHIVFGGRLGSYRYQNMDQVIGTAMELVEKLI